MSLFRVLGSTAIFLSRLGAAEKKRSKITWNFCLNVGEMDPMKKISELPNPEYKEDWNTFYKLIDNFEFEKAWDYIKNCRVDGTEDQMQYFMRSLRNAIAEIDHFCKCESIKKYPVKHLGKKIRVKDKEIMLWYKE
jgi:hypothetical protein